LLDFFFQIEEDNLGGCVALKVGEETWVQCFGGKTLMEETS
jgi:hypothetical protein